MEHTKPFWSGEEVAEAISYLESSLEQRYKREKDAMQMQVERQRIYRRLHDAAEAFDTEKQKEHLTELYTLKVDFEKLVTEARSRKLHVQDLAARASFSMNANDYRFLLSHKDAEALIDLLPQYPTGSLYEVIHYMNLENIVYHASTYWDPTGCRYIHDGQDGSEIRVIVVGTAKSLLLWLFAEYQHDDPIVGEFQKCEDQALIEAYVRQHKMTADIEKGDDVEH